ncbi:type II toxin-antitoxin system RelE/ParE family toxin [Citreicella sp. C3M06]|uniref:type II toxin-antitoxin system RelE/ParE family toxin n=1 Tax=Roseobacteraceae TaxID=2854170 RepID=UPI001C0A4CD9|nr:MULTISPECIES: type II toxin-antitoxin system RelE/ParE family toxin [Roseobacteraceae]MBU2961380.1 type II toxin-antitoxin system RelE/ParE family toxin [Citreicella sp. C3M06]MDO6584717.1 type II toxin-antitoxin system RelE/ParE family toxin [Salipiger sp. 1_MG-2023]
MVYEIRRAVACRRDLESIFDHLLNAYGDLGASPQEAFDQAVNRLHGIEEDIDALARQPHQGTLWPEVMDGLRWVTRRRAIFYFRIDETARRIDLLAVFFGGQDHKVQILARIRQG